MDYPLLVVSPPIAAAAAIILVRRERIAGHIAFIGVVISGLLAAFMLKLAVKGSVTHTTLSTFGIAGSSVKLQLRVDALGATMAMLVSGIAIPVFAYAIAYMRDEEDKTRFFTIFSLFAGAMLALVLADDYLTLYASWEIVGFCSYLLIGQYTHQEDAAKASFKAFFTTGIGDLGLLLGIALLFAHLGSVSFSTVFQTAQSGHHPSVLTPAACLILIGALGKSAQFPFHVWLPDAMAGPTPVSALLHSATMVAAGIFLIARSWPLFLTAPAALHLLLVLTTATALFAALTACAQQDIKRLLAYSTISQVGEMGMALGIGAAAAGVFHLISQAVFKALLFLAVGIITKFTGTRQMQEISDTNNAARIGFFIGAISLSAVPPFGGFWSKEVMTSAAHGWILAAYSMLSLLSAFYIARAYFLVFRPAYPNRTVGSLFTLPTLFLAFATSSLGLLVVPFHSGWLRVLGEVKVVRFSTSTVSHLLLVALGWGAAWCFYRRESSGVKRFSQSGVAVSQIMLGGFGTDTAARWFASVMQSVASAAAMFDSVVFDRTANAFASMMLNVAGLSEEMDNRAIDRSFERSAVSIRGFGSRLRVLQTGRIYHYLAAVFAWVLLTALITFIVRII